MQAVSMCTYTADDPFNTMPEKELLATSFPDLDLYDEKVVNFSVEDRIQMIKDLESSVLAFDSRLKPEGSELFAADGSSAMANSLGFCEGQNVTVMGLNTSVFAEDDVGSGDLNTGRKQSDYWYSRAHHLANLDSLEDLAAKAAKRTLRKLGARKPQTGKFPVYFEPEVARTLWGHLLGSINGNQLYRNESYLTNRLETAVCSPKIQVIDDPHIPQALGSRAFDGEGVACQRRDLIKDGVLKTYLLGTYAANKLKMRSTGHASGAHNLFIQSGSKSEEELLQTMGTGIWVTGLLGQGVSLSTGEYSRGASGLWVENGEVQYPIMEFTLNGKLDDMFKNIAHLGKDINPKWVIRTPGLLIEEMTISGT